MRNKRLAMVRADPLLPRKSSKCVQCEEPNYFVWRYTGLKPTHQSGRDFENSLFRISKTLSLQFWDIYNGSNPKDLQIKLQKYA